MAPVAAAAFEETFASVESSWSDATSQYHPDPAEIGHRAALVAASSLVWRDHIGPLLSGPDVRRMLDVGTRQAVNDLVKRRRLLALPGRSKRLLFPAFQFREDGRPYSVIPQILDAFADSGVTPHSIASWFSTPQALLDDQTPAQWLKADQDPEPMIRSARRVAERLRD